MASRRKCDWLGTLRIPTFVAAGTEDVVIPVSNALKLVNAIPGAWLAQFEGSGHAFIAHIHGRWRISSMGFSPFERARSSSNTKTITDAYRVHAFQRLRIGFA